MRATIKDIAAATGFSVTTISLVLNGKGYKISDETKNQILAKARELNYRPNQLAVSLVKRQSKTIGFIVPVFPMYILPIWRVRSMRRAAKMAGV